MAPGQQIAGPGQFAHRRPSQDSHGSGARAVASAPTLNSSTLPAPSWSLAALRPSGTAILRADSGTRHVGPSLRSGAGGATQQYSSARSSPLATRRRARRRASDLCAPEYSARHLPSSCSLHSPNHTNPAPFKLVVVLLLGERVVGRKNHSPRVDIKELASRARPTPFVALASFKGR